MERQHLFGLSCTVAAMALTTMAAATSPATAATSTCRTTISGGVVGNEVVNSSSDVYAEAIAARQRVTVDQVTVNYFGQTRYRLAAPIKLVDTRGVATRAFKGGTGYFVDGDALALTAAFTACTEAIGG